VAGRQLWMLTQLLLCVFMFHGTDLALVSVCRPAILRAAGLFADRTIKVGLLHTLAISGMSCAITCHVTACKNWLPLFLCRPLP
jgi:hypothetical protein